MSSRTRRGHFCWCCRRTRPNEHFSGRNHARHLCRECARLPAEARAIRAGRRGAGLTEASTAPAAVGDALDRFIGRWSEADEKRILESIAPCEAVDKALWK